VQQEAHRRVGKAPTELLWRGDRTMAVQLTPGLEEAFWALEFRLMAGELVTRGARALAANPLLTGIVATAQGSPAWQAAAAGHAALLANRLVARELPDEWRKASVVFASAALVLVQLGREQITFHCDGTGLARGAEVEVGGLWQSWTGSLGARRLRVGDRELELKPRAPGATG
jgi:hypothetical protein